jgi:lactate dehydrogenase-like 2-hydroxyacid dehydrogenase
MKVAFFSAHKYDRASFELVNGDATDLEFTFLEPTLNTKTAILAAGHEAVCLFVNDDASAQALEILHEQGVKFIGLRCAGYNNVDLKKAAELGMIAASVPAYSPDAVAEFAVGMILTLSRKYHKAYPRVRDGNFLLDGLLGKNIKGKQVGLIGTGRIGLCAGKILAHGFGANVIAYDPYPAKDAAEYGITYVQELNELLTRSDIISIHCPLLDSTKHIINEDTIARMKQGVILVNTSRGGLIDTGALIKGLKEGKFGAVGMDVYEKESEYFFQDSSDKVIQDDQLSRLLSFHTVFVSGHQAFFTEEALHGIAETTLANLRALSKGEECKNVVKT